jgi:hypothetical protein
MRLARFRTVARTDKAIPTPCHVYVDRDSLTFTVKPLRRRRTYQLPLSTVAEIVVGKIIKAEIAALRAAKKGRRDHAQR